MFDLLRSAVPAPDHLFFMGITRSIMDGCFNVLAAEYFARVSCSLLEALALSGLRRTRPYNLKADKLNSIGMSEWAATLSVAYICFQRALPVAVTTVTPRRTPVQEMLHILALFSSLVCRTYYYPRCSLDGADACTQAASIVDLQTQVNEFLSTVDAGMRRVDCLPFVALIDRPNRHGLQEVYYLCLPGGLHTRHASELYFESAHQPLKRAVVNGNAHDDARTAMSRMLETACFSRIAAEPRKFNVPPHFWKHVGIAAQLREAVSLRTLLAGPWSVSSRVVLSDDVPSLAVSLARQHCGPGYSVPWRRGATRGRSKYLRVGDTVSAISRAGAAGLAVVPVLTADDASQARSDVSFYQVIALYTSVRGDAVSIVHPYVSAWDNLWTVDATRALSITMSSSVRRSLALHACTEKGLSTGDVHISHSKTRLWHVLGRAPRFPSISG